MKKLYTTIGFSALSFILGLVFVFSALSKYYPIEPFEFTIVETGFVNWKWSLILARIIIAIELAIGLLLMFSYKLKFTLTVTLSLLVFFSLHLIYVLIFKGNFGDCGCFGDILPMTPLQGLLKNIGLLILALFLFKNRVNWELKLKYLHLYVVLLSTIFVFSQNMIDFSYSSNYLNKPFKNYNLNLDTIYKTSNFEKIGKTKTDVRNQKIVLAFLSSSCEHCRIAAKKLALIKKLNPKIPMYFFINGDDSDIVKFVKKTNSNAIQNSKLNGETFIKMAGVKLPVIYYFNKGTVEKQVDYYTLEQYHIEDWLKK